MAENIVLFKSSTSTVILEHTQSENIIITINIDGILTKFSPSDPICLEPIFIEKAMITVYKPDNIVISVKNEQNHLHNKYGPALIELNEIGNKYAIYKHFIKGVCDSIKIIHYPSNDMEIIEPVSDLAEYNLIQLKYI
jgi:hypothetical protein